MSTAADERLHDFFISYKSENVEIVRPIAELLLGNGLRVWFSEHSLSIDTFLGTKEKLEESMLFGTSNTKFGICFTNEQYFASSWCRMELKGLIKSLDPSRVIQIRVPGQKLSTQVARLLDQARIDEIQQLRETVAASPTINHSSTVRTLRQIESISGIQLDLPLWDRDSNPSNRMHFYFRDKHLSADFSGWRVRRTWSLPGMDGNVAGPTFERQFDHGLVTGRVQIGPQDPEVARIRSGEGAAESTSLSSTTESDLRYYFEAARFARYFVYQKLKEKLPPNQHASVHGIHLLFLLGHSQMAITTHVGTSDDAVLGRGGEFHRMYSIVLPERGSQPDTEILFEFKYRGHYWDMYKYTPYMDQLVLSLESELIGEQQSLPTYKENLRSWNREPALWIAAVLLFLFAGFVPGMNNPWSGKTITETGLTALLVTQVVGSLASLHSLRVRRLFRSLILVIVMIVCGFWSSLISIQIFENLLKKLNVNPQQMSFVFGVLMLFTGNLVGFLTLAWSQRPRNAKTSR